MTACATRCLPLSSKHSDRPPNAAEITAKKRVRDDQIVELPATKRASRAENEDDEVVIVEPPTARDGKDLEEQYLRVIEKREAELRLLKAMRDSLDL
jgi:hypothetical protein